MTSFVGVADRQDYDVARVMSSPLDGIGTAPGAEAMAKFSAAAEPKPIAGTNLQHQAPGTEIREDHSTFSAPDIQIRK